MRLSRSNWPAGPDSELVRVRALADTKEFIWRATTERALVDGLSRPELAAGIETVVTCWAHARRTDLDWNLVCAVANRRGKSMQRRCAYMLRMLDLDAAVKRNFPGLTGRGANIPLDRGNSFAMTSEEMTRDRGTGVPVNVPRDHLRGWVSAGT